MKIFAKDLEEQAKEQILELANSKLGEGANIRIMPDAHLGVGCVIGTTLKVIDKVCPNIVGVDIACGVHLYETDIKFEDKLEELDYIINKFIPAGHNNHNRTSFYKPLTKLRCWEKLPKKVIENAKYSLGTLGGGNHFIEAYKGGKISVHSGSRNIGYNVAKYYQTLAEKENRDTFKEELKNIEPKLREQFIIDYVPPIKKEMSYLTGQLMEDYLHDTKILNEFAIENRRVMIQIIVDKLGGNILDEIISTHNYIDVDNMILRKGAVSAQKREKLVIPLNMRDGILVGIGKGNEDWNYSAPHGAGRLYSRRKARELFKLEDFKETMEGIYSTSVVESTIDEAPFAYKDYKEIMELIEPSVTILEILIPIYNFKAK